MSSEACDEKAAVSPRRRHRTGVDLERRALRAETLIQMGELSSVRQALEGADLAKGDRRTLGLLTDVNRRPDRLRDPLPELTAEQLFARNLRSSRRGVAGGPSGRLDQGWSTHSIVKTRWWVRGIVAGDVIRRLVARTMSQQLSEAVERAAPINIHLARTHRAPPRIDHHIDRRHWRLRHFT